MDKKKTSAAESQENRSPVSYCQITHHIRVSVVPEFIDEHSDPERGVYVFAYTVKIENLGDETVQLLRRKWVVMSGGSLYTEVVGDGVVGEQPILESGDVYEYTSSSVIKDPVGAMHGSYTFQTEQVGLTSDQTIARQGSEGHSSGDVPTFEVLIPEFDLVFPGSVH